MYDILNQFLKIMSEELNEFTDISPYTDAEAVEALGKLADHPAVVEAVSYTHLTLPTILNQCRSRWSPYH